jgi:carbonic anhydrase
MAHNDEVLRLFTNNRAWAERLRREDPGIFERLRNQQTPEFLWIGCSDSRVPANQIVGLAPGEVFVHRNIANVVSHADLNCLSVLQYAIDVLGVRHVIVCGHYGCGGVIAAHDNLQLGVVDNWLEHVKDVHRAHAGELDDLPGRDLRIHRLCELNVMAQVKNVCHTTVVQAAWRRGQAVQVHGFIYSLEDGLLRDLEVRQGPVA